MWLGNERCPEYSGNTEKQHQGREGRGIRLPVQSENE